MRCLRYPADGTCFQRHVDNTSQDGRKLSAIAYFNPGWAAADGGALRVYPSNGPPVDVLPIAGRLALFFADTMPHEVLPSWRHRHSAMIWYCDLVEMSAAEREARERGMLGGIDGSRSHDEQREAKVFIQELLSGESTRTEDMARAAEKLSAGALSIVAAVIGGSADNVVPTMRGLTAAALRKLRRELATGLGTP